VDAKSQWIIEKIASNYPVANVCEETAAVTRPTEEPPVNIAVFAAV
jgi:hypothetical protein